MPRPVAEVILLRARTGITKKHLLFASPQAKANNKCFYLWIVVGRAMPDE